MTNTQKLKAKIVEMRYSNASLAQKIGISQTSLSLKINNHREFTASEIKNISDLLGISDKEIYFFA